ncbi:hypothetical protein [Alteromonas gilva]|uniref:Succinate dehydrogenase n=1 Tax=Alteromonas gilva TaxID=2987522 RepID=A0ABT5L6Q9_9ALTE|nr:hypothetical protein [Alteromonas gilva]MDC8832724.1 hypothetical protein [Alteromonas gilva]
MLYETLFKNGAVLMIKIIVLIPLILSLIWFGYLTINNYSVADGKQGFKYILLFSCVIAAFFTLMYWLTH